jgi:hypothetical protein
MKKSFVVVLLYLISLFNISWGQDRQIEKTEKKLKVRVGIAYFPEHSPHRNAALPKLIERIGEEAGLEVDFRIYPFSRSYKYLLEGKIDVHVPLIYSDGINLEEIPYIYNDETIWKANFVVYTHKSKKIRNRDFSHLDLYTDQVHPPFFDFPVTPLFNIEHGIGMVNKNRIDGLIFADTIIDGLIKKFQLDQIERTFYAEYDVKLLIIKNKRTPLINAAISMGIKKLKASGELKERTKVFNTPYDNWQPYRDL